jgi:hypothetical protein
MGEADIIRALENEAEDESLQLSDHEASLYPRERW